MLPIIEVKKLSKEYVLSHNAQPYYTLRDSLSGLVRKIIAEKLKEECLNGGIIECSSFADRLYFLAIDRVPRCAIISLLKPPALTP